jgi:hypothetical protein
MKLSKIEAIQGDESQDRFSGLASAVFIGPSSDGCRLFPKSEKNFSQLKG